VNTLLAGVLIVLATTARAGSLVLAPESRLWLEGDSTLHPYKSTATQLAVVGEAAAESPAGLLQAGAVAGFALTVPVKGLKSGKKGLDENLYKAVQAEEHPDILFRMDRFSAVPSGEGFRVTAEGALTVAGREKPVTLEADAEIAGGRLRVTGTEPLLMTDFGIKPPALMLGAIKTRNEVVIHYDIFIGTQSEKTGGDSHE